MARLLRRLLVLVILGAATAAAVRALRAQRPVPLGSDGAAASMWPPLGETNGPTPDSAEGDGGADEVVEVVEVEVVEVEVVEVVETVAPAPDGSPSGGATWVQPDGGGCPDGYPVKATQSGIFHVPGGQFYARSAAMRCYVSAEAAAADGFRKAKR